MARARDLQDRCVVVTGASRGIGFETARAFLDAGARVAICARNRERLERAAAELDAGERLLHRAADVTEVEDLRGFLRAAVEAFGPIAVLVNNAGVLYSGPFVEEPLESIDRTIAVNLAALMRATRLTLPDMLSRGEGVIVNIGSGAGLTGHAEIVSYSASKFGVVGFSEALHDEVSARGVRVYALCPGRVATDMQVQYTGKKQGIAPERVAQRVVELAAKGSRDPVVTLR